MFKKFIDRQEDRQSDRQTDRYTDRDREAERENIHRSRTPQIDIREKRKIRNNDVDVVILVRADISISTDERTVKGEVS